MAWLGRMGCVVVGCHSACPYQPQGHDPIEDARTPNDGADASIDHSTMDEGWPRFDLGPNPSCDPDKIWVAPKATRVSAVGGAQHPTIVAFKDSFIVAWSSHGVQVRLVSYDGSVLKEKYHASTGFEVDAPALAATESEIRFAWTETHRPTTCARELLLGRASSELGPNLSLCSLVDHLGVDHGPRDPALLYDPKTQKYYMAVAVERGGAGGCSYQIRPRFGPVVNSDGECEPLVDEQWDTLVESAARYPILAAHDDALVMLFLEGPEVESATTGFYVHTYRSVDRVAWEPLALSLTSDALLGRPALVAGSGLWGAWSETDAIALWHRSSDSPASAPFRLSGGIEPALAHMPGSDQMVLVYRHIASGELHVGFPVAGDEKILPRSIHKSSGAPRQVSVAAQSNGIGVVWTEDQVGGTAIFYKWLGCQP